MPGRPFQVTLAQHFEGAVDTQVLRVPDGEYAVVFRLLVIVQPLGAADRRGRQFLVHPRLEPDMVFLEQRGRRPQRIIVDPDRRTPIAGNVAGRVQSRGDIALALYERKPHQRLVGRDIDATFLLREFVVYLDCCLSHACSLEFSGQGLAPAEIACSAALK
ncbi:hypothetical protein D3872_07650 [Massilia cavernae]|uniref:Uncharacterized protein n=1 Tax=Massilia cavernae TaxID=2320864 RepID=A0A418Y4N2_9BURK|nr:hypothetical protein D3872_07650 [Massilia cavernae]